MTRVLSPRPAPTIPVLIWRYYQHIRSIHRYQNIVLESPRIGYWSLWKLLEEDC